MPTPNDAGIKALRKIQLGRNADSDSDDVIPATTIWRGTGTLEDTRNLYFVQEDVGIAMGTDRTNTSFLGGKITLDPIEATYEQFPHLLEMCVKTVSPTSDSGGGSGWIYTYALPTTALNTVKPYTLEGGDNKGAEVLNYVHGAGFTLAGNSREAWKMSGDLFGKQVVDQAFTSSLALPTVYNMNFPKTKIYIDADSDNWGTTLKSQTLLSATLKYNTMAEGKPTADGELTFTFVQQKMPDVTLAVVFEHNTNAINEKTQWRNENARLIRLLNEGAALTTPGVYTYRTCLVDLAGKWEKFNKIGERNGNDILEGTFRARYNDTKASSGQIVIVNELSSLP